MSNSTNPNDGGPAFPSHGSMGEVSQEGMSLRAWFAGQALSGLCARISETRFADLRDDIQGGRNEAKVARLLANAMIAELDLLEKHDAEDQP